MDFETLKTIENEAERTAATYELFNEDMRLNRSKTAHVEFFTTVRAIESALFPGARILDIGAGAGEYSLHFARLGYDVTAVELAPVNVEAFRKKIAPEYPVRLLQGNALDLSAFPDGRFDVVLLMGPLYHLISETDQDRAIAEAKRVCSPDGTMFFSFISNDMVILTELSYHNELCKYSESLTPNMEDAVIIARINFVEPKKGSISRKKVGGQMDIIKRYRRNITRQLKTRMNTA